MNKKKQREEAIKREQARRQAERASGAPIDREQLVSLVNYIGEHILQSDERDSFTHSEAWAKESGVEAGSLIVFLKKNDANEDWSVPYECDPFETFGPSETRLRWMPIEEDSLEELLEHLDGFAEENGCDHKLTETQKWLTKDKHPVFGTMMALIVNGGGCDCEVVLNVEPEGIYP